jgi:hypothetical protein
MGRSPEEAEKLWAPVASGALGVGVLATDSLTQPFAMPSV